MKRFSTVILIIAILLIAIAVLRPRLQVSEDTRTFLFSVRGWFSAFDLKEGYISAQTDEVVLFSWYDSDPGKWVVSIVWIKDGQLMAFWDRGTGGTRYFYYPGLGGDFAEYNDGVKILPALKGIWIGDAGVHCTEVIGIGTRCLS